DLEKQIETSDEWIRTRTGIEERRIAADDEPTSVLAAKAAEAALKVAGISASELDLIIVATICPDQIFPNTACHVQRRIGASPTAMCFDIEAACTGFVYGIEIATSMLRSGMHKTALVIGAEEMSKLVDWEDRTTCVLFGDGAGAMILSATENAEECALIASSMHANGEHTSILEIPGGGTLLPFSEEVLKSKSYFLRMEGQAVFKLAVNSMVKACKKVLEEANMSIDDINWLVPHQANNRIISAVGKGLGVADEKVFVNVNKYANTSSATVPIALDEMSTRGLVKRGDFVLCVAFGAGLTWGASLLKW
ncbi:MAG: beta-ketoacyl-ACP synthase III, partial [Lentisphaeria bacterium]